MKGLHQWSDNGLLNRSEIYDVEASVHVGWTELWITRSWGPSPSVLDGIWVVFNNYTRSYSGSSSSSSYQLLSTSRATAATSSTLYLQPIPLPSLKEPGGATERIPNDVDGGSIPHLPSHSLDFVPSRLIDTNFAVLIIGTWWEAHGKLFVKSFFFSTGNLASVKMFPDSFTGSNDRKRDIDKKKRFPKGGGWDARRYTRLVIGTVSPLQAASGFLDRMWKEEWMKVDV